MRGAILKPSQYVSHSPLMYPSNSPHSRCSGMARGMLKRAMITHMTMTSVRDHLPPKASQKLTWLGLGVGIRVRVRVRVRARVRVRVRVRVPFGLGFGLEP